MTASPIGIHTSMGGQEGTPSTRKRVGELLEDAKSACNRPLFDDIALKASDWDAKTAQYLNISSKPFKWERLLSESAELACQYTEEEHGVMSQIAAIYLLGFLNPYSTGCDFQSLRSSPPTESGTSTSETIFEMDLQERLENTSRFFHAHEFGEVDVVKLECREAAFVSFLRKGLLPFISSRAVHAVSTDVYHLLAMAICPEANCDIIGNTCSQLEEQQSPAWVKAARLMESLHAHSFQLHYAHRVEIVKIASCIVLPVSDASFVHSGLVPHLVAALHTFACSAITAADANLAHKAIVNIVTQTNLESFVREIFYALLSQTIEDTNQCHCCSDQKFCPHWNRGRLLHDCIVKFNGSRHFADKVFTEQCFSALSHTIEKTVAPWEKKDEELPTQHGACLLSALLHASEALFYFILKDNVVDTTPLLETSIQLLHHPSNQVSSAAMSLLGIAFTYLPDRLDDVETRIGPVFESVKLGFQDRLSNTPDLFVAYVNGLKQLAPVVARRSVSFASALLGFLVEQQDGSKIQGDVEFEKDAVECTARLTALVSCANPIAAFARIQGIRDALKKQELPRAQIQLLASLLATRQAYASHEEGEVLHGAITDALSNQDDNWYLYTIARQAIVTGNFRIAESVYKRLMQYSKRQESFVWLCALSKIAEAEALLLEEGSAGVPSATTVLVSAVTYIDSMTNNFMFEFQVELLGLRLDFLDLIAATRNLCVEVRLSGTVPNLTSRSGMHIVNALRCWGALAGRYFLLYRQYGLFLSFQTRSSLRTIHAICRECGEIGKRLLIEAVPHFHRDKGDQFQRWPKGDCLHSSIRMLQRLQDEDLLKQYEYAEPSVRATAFMELLEGILKSPFPYPKCFTCSHLLTPATFAVALEPCQKYSMLEDFEIMEASSIQLSTTVYPGTPIKLVASGSIPAKLVRSATTPFSVLLVRYSITFVSTLDGNDCVSTESPQGLAGQWDDGESCNIKHAESQPSKIQLTKTRDFYQTFEVLPIKHVGIYKVQFKLACRDISGCVWHLPVIKSSASNAILVRVSRRLH